MDRAGSTAVTELPASAGEGSYLDGSDRDGRGEN